MRPLTAPRRARVVAVAAAVTFVASSAADQPVPAQAQEWIPPVGGVVVRPFVAPIAEYAAGHRGVDFTATSGTAVRAANDGTVSFAGTVAGALHVVVAHEGGIRTSYSFLASVDVDVGQQVVRSQVVGRAGGSGEGHGAGILHFGVRIGDRYVDPMLLFRPRDLTQIVRLVPPEELASADDATAADERRELVEQLRDSFGCAICDATGWVGDRAEEAFQEGRRALEGALDEVDEQIEAAIDAAENALELAVEAAAEVRAAILSTPVGLLATDLVGAGASLLGWFGRECDDAAPPANGRGGSGNVMLAVAGIDSHQESPDARSMNLPARLLGYDKDEQYWYSYRENSDTYGPKDTRQDLRKSARLLAEQLKRAAKEQPGRKFDLVGHSQGGVVIALFLTEYYAGHESEYPPVENAVTLASPLDGTPLGTSGADIGRSPVGEAMLDLIGDAGEGVFPPPNATSVRQLAEDSDVIKELRNAHVPEDVHFTSISGVNDWQVPSLQTRFNGAESHHIDAGDALSSHSGITHHPRALMAARAALEHRALPCTSFDEALRASVGSSLVSAIERYPAAASPI
jgi:pimeloyl-ACP methyl ester carboxylesterase